VSVADGIVLRASDLAPGLALGTNVKLADDVVIGANVVIHDGVEVHQGCSIRDGAVIGKMPVLAPTSSVPRTPPGQLFLAKQVTIGTGAIVFGGRIGRGAIVGDQAHLRERAVVGEATVVGRGSAIGRDAVVGVRIQTNVWMTSYSVTETTSSWAPASSRRMTTQWQEAARCFEAPGFVAPAASAAASF